MSDSTALNRLALGGMTALAAGIGLGRFVYTPILPVMADGLALTKGEAGFIASANFLGYLLGALITTVVKLPGSSRFWLLSSLIANAAALAWIGLTTSYPLIVALRCFGGVASAFIFIFGSSMVLDRLTSSGRGDLSAVHFAGVGIGIAISSALVSAILQAGAGWQSLWLGNAALSFAAVALVAWLVPGAGAGAAVPRNGATEQRSNRLPALICAYGLFGFGYIITATFLVAIVRGSPDLAVAEPYVWILVGITAAISVSIWNWVSSRTGALIAFALGCIVEAIGVACTVLWVSTPGIMLSAILFGGTFMGITTLGLVAARELAGGSRGNAIAGMTTAIGVGQTLGPSFAGLLHDTTGSFLLPSLGAAVALAAAAAISWAISARHN